MSDHQHYSSSGQELVKYIIANRTEIPQLPSETGHWETAHPRRFFSEKALKCFQKSQLYEIHNFSVIKVRNTLEPENVNTMGESDD